MHLQAAMAHTPHHSEWQQLLREPSSEVELQGEEAATPTASPEEERDRRAAWDEILHRPQGSKDSMQEQTSREEESAQPLFELPRPGQRSAVRRGRPRKIFQGSSASTEVSAEEPQRQQEAHPAPAARAPSNEAAGSAARPPAFPRQCPQVPPKTPLLQRSSEGAAVDSALTQCLLAAYQASLEPGCRLDDKVVELAEKYMNPAYHLSSQIVMQEQMDLEAKAIIQRLHRLACSLWLQQRADRASLERGLVHYLPPSSLVFYGDFCSYDETPMLTSVRLPHSSSSDTQPRPRIDIAAPPHVAALDALSGGVPTPAIATKTKLLQVRSGFSMLVKLEASSGAERAPFHCYIVGETACPLQGMTRNNADTLLECLHRLQANTQAAASFPLKLRGVVLDEAKANLAAEQMLLQHRDPSWCPLTLPCDTHKASRCHSKSFDTLMPQDVSGLVRTALSLREGGKMALFRAALGREVRERLVILRGEASLDAQHHREHVLNLFVSTGPHALWRRVLLLQVANGDWRNAGVIEHYVPSCVDHFDEETICATVERSLVAALANGQPPVWPRHRWTGSDEAVDVLGIMFALHDLFHHVYARFLAMVGGRRQGEQEDEDRAVSGTQPEGPPPPPENMAASTIPEDSDPALLPNRPPVADTSEPQPEPNSAEQNAKQRQQAWSWISSDPLSRLVLMRITLFPLSTLIQQQLELGSHDYEQKERAKMAVAMSQGDSRVQARDYPLGVAAMGTLEAKFHDSLNQLWQHSPLWSLIPPKKRTVQTRALAFRLLSRAAASVHHLLSESHQTCPVRLYKLLADPDLAPTLAEQPPCVKDSWTQALQKQYPRFSEPEFMNILIGLGCSLRTDISSIEAKHASIRRQLTSKSIQTWRLGLSQASSEWILQGCRRKGTSKSSQTMSNKSSKKVQDLSTLSACLKITIQF